MTTLVHTASLACVVAGLIAGAITGIAVSDGRFAQRVALDFWLAAGLLNLTAARDWESLAAATLILAVRQTASFALQHAPAHEDGEP